MHTRYTHTPGQIRTFQPQEQDSLLLNWSLAMSIPVFPCQHTGYSYGTVPTPLERIFILRFFPYHSGHHGSFPLMQFRGLTTSHFMTNAIAFVVLNSSIVGSAHCLAQTDVLNMSDHEYLLHGFWIHTILGNFLSSGLTSTDICTVNCFG